MLRTGIAFDKKTHRSKFLGGQAEKDYGRFYRYLQYAAANTFDHLDAIIWDVLADLLDAWGQTEVLDWFVKTLVGVEGHWMLCHGGAGNCNHNNSVESRWRYMKESCLGDKGRNGGLSLVKFNSNLITYIETESKEWMNKLKTEGMMESFPNKGSPTKKTYDQLQSLQVGYLVVCDVNDGDSRRFDELKRLVLTIQCEGMLFEHIKSVIDSNAKLALFECVELVFISEFGIKDLGLDLIAGSDRKLRSAEFKERLAAYKKMVNPILTTIEKAPGCEGKEFFKVLNSFHLVKFYGPGMRTTCSCKDYFHDRFCVHVLCVIAMSDPEFQIPVALIQCDPELRKRRGRRRYIHGEDIGQDEVKGKWNPTYAEPTFLGVMPLPRSLIAHKVVDAPGRDGFIGPRKLVVPAWKAMYPRFDSSDDEEDADDDDVSTMGCSSKSGIFDDRTRMKGFADMELEELGGRVDRQEHFFRGPMAIETLNRKEAAMFRRSLDRPRVASSDLSDGEELKEMKQKVYFCILWDGRNLQWCYTDVWVFDRTTTGVGQNGNVGDAKPRNQR